MDTAQNQVRQFMLKAGQDFPEKPEAPNETIRKLRVKLLLEEVLEFAKATGVKIIAEISDHAGLEEQIDAIHYYANEEVDLIEGADALADIKYVNEGAAVAYGIDLEPVFNEVHDSNMTKWWKRDELEKMKEGWTATDLFDGTFCVRDAQGKVIKSPSYRPANLEPIILAQLHA